VVKVVERVARVICAKSFEDASVYWGDDTIPEAVDRNWKDYVGDARAALAAIRVPTELMMQAGMNVGAFPMCHGEVEVRYQAMIDAALSE
jgi:hypothetical protein